MFMMMKMMMNSSSAEHRLYPCRTRSD